MSDTGTVIGLIKALGGSGGGGGSMTVDSELSLNSEHPVQNKIVTEAINTKATIDDTAGSSDTDKTWSADKLVSEIGNIESLLAAI